MFPMVDSDVDEVLFFAGLGVCPLVVFEAPVDNQEIALFDEFGGSFGLFIPEFEGEPVGAVLPFSVRGFVGG